MKAPGLRREVALSGSRAEFALERAGVGALAADAAHRRLYQQVTSQSGLQPPDEEARARGL